MSRKRVPLLLRGDVHRRRYSGNQLKGFLPEGGILERGG